MQTFIHWAKRTTSVPQRVAILALGVLIFPVLLPAFLTLILPKLDKILFPTLYFAGLPALILGILLMLLGFALAMWTIVMQVTRASGTPFPMVPTQRLLTSGPFALCRNPMTLGTIVAYLGVALAVGSLSAILVVALFGALLILYCKRIEENELEMRFGAEYVAYKAATPFIIPDFRNWGK
jgi:protein-S-isoprenylcysteine O-methyltransferase Ste14